MTTKNNENGKGKNNGKENGKEKEIDLDGYLDDTEKKTTKTLKYYELTENDKEKINGILNLKNKEKKTYLELIKNKTINVFRVKNDLEIIEKTKTKDTKVLKATYIGLCLYLKEKTEREIKYKTTKFKDRTIIRPNTKNDIIIVEFK